MESSSRLVESFVLLLVLTLTQSKLSPERPAHNAVENNSKQNDSLYLTFQAANEAVQMFSCDKLKVSGYTAIAFPKQKASPDLTCNCVIKDILYVAVLQTNLTQENYCYHSDSCTEPKPARQPSDVQIKFTQEYVEVSDKMGNVYKHVKPTEKLIDIFFYFLDQDITCTLERITPTPASTSPPVVTTPHPSPPIVPGSGNGQDGHSHDVGSQAPVIVIALAGSVVINIIIIILAVFLYHKLNTRNMKKHALSHTTTPAMQLNNSEMHLMNNGITSITQPNSPGYTPLGVLNPILIPAGMQISNGTTESTTDDGIYGDTYTPSRAVEGAYMPGNYHNNRFNVKFSAVSMSDVSSSCSSNMTSSTSRMLSSSTGNLQHVQKPTSSSQNNLDMIVPAAGAVGSSKQLKKPPYLPMKPGTLARNVSKNSNSYDYIECDTFPAEQEDDDEIKREPSHKYLQIT